MQGVGQMATSLIAFRLARRVSEVGCVLKLVLLLGELVVQGNVILESKQSLGILILHLISLMLV